MNPLEELEAVHAGQFQIKKNDIRDGELWTIVVRRVAEEVMGCLLSVLDPVQGEARIFLKFHLDELGVVWIILNQKKVFGCFFVHTSSSTNCGISRSFNMVVKASFSSAWIVANL